MLLKIGKEPIIDFRDLLRQKTPRVQVPNNPILTQNLYYNDSYPKPKYLILGTGTLWERNNQCVA